VHRCLYLKVRRVLLVCAARDGTQRQHPEAAPRDGTQRRHPETAPRGGTQRRHPETAPRRRCRARKRTRCAQADSCVLPAELLALTFGRASNGLYCSQPKTTMGKQSTGRRRRRPPSKKKKAGKALVPRHGGNGIPEWKPCVRDTVSVTWYHTNGTKADYLGQVVGTAFETETGTTDPRFTVKYYEDDKYYSHTLDDTQFTHSFSAESSCLKYVGFFAANKRLLVTDGALKKLSKLHLRLATCKDKRKMFRGWRECQNKFWTVFDECVHIKE
jgi:hypothetical protein